MNRLLVVIGVAALAWIAVIVTILLLVTALGWGEQQPTTWREPAWLPPEPITVTVERDCSIEHGLYKKMCETGALPD